MQIKRKTTDQKKSTINKTLEINLIRYFISTGIDYKLIKEQKIDITRTHEQHSQFLKARRASDEPGTKALTIGTYKPIASKLAVEMGHPPMETKKAYGIDYRRQTEIQTHFSNTREASLLQNKQRESLYKTSIPPIP